MNNEKNDVSSCNDFLNYVEIFGKFAMRDWSGGKEMIFILQRVFIIFYIYFLYLGL